MTTTATEKRSTDERGNGKDRRRKERLRNSTESIGRDLQWNRNAMRGIAMKQKRIDGQRNGKAKIPRRRNPAERMEI